MVDPAARIETWVASDGYISHYRIYVPQHTPKAQLVCLHGIQSHGGWYEYSSSRLCAAGYAVYYLDRRGSGLNQVDRGDAPSFRRLLDDIAEFSAARRVERPELPIVVLACSWGGKLAAALCRRHPRATDGLILLCPGFFPKVQPPFARRLQVLWSRLIQPQRRFPIPLNDPELFTATPHWRTFIASDPLALHEATARLLVESVRLDAYLRFAPKHIQVPTLLLLAGHDRIINNDRTARLFAHFRTPNKKCITFPDTHHTLEFEPEPEFFVDEILAWLENLPLPTAR